MVLKFHTWIPHGKIADQYVFIVRVVSPSGVMPLCKNQDEILSARYLENCLSLKNKVIFFKFKQESTDHPLSADQVSNP